MTALSAPVLFNTPLAPLHHESGARMVPFAGYSMPVQYARGILAEHHYCRHSAALFDVSHMGQISVRGAQAAQALESLLPIDVEGLRVGQQRYAFFTAPNGGILDDLMITRRPDDYLLVVNASCKEADLHYLQTHLGHLCTIQALADVALLALQGPLAAMVLSRLTPEALRQPFMTGATVSLLGTECFVTRSGYTGEDGFEIAVPNDHAETLARALLSFSEVQLAGLGARDTLRLEAGLCLYGHDINTATTPIEAGLSWAIQKVRRPGGARAGGYPGAEILETQLLGGPRLKRVGLIGLERVPVREGARLLALQGPLSGHVTSGTISPTVNQPIAMAYLPPEHAEPGHELWAEVRGQRYPMRVTPLPFVAHRYYRG
ncbi:MAG: glycine cleavage system aminomethyltransferase GcvT [Burkholderiales bacterium]